MAHKIKVVVTEEGTRLQVFVQNDDVDVATFYDAAPRGPSLVRRLFERVRRACFPSSASRVW